MLNNRKRQIRADKFKELCFSNDLNFLDVDDYGLLNLLKFFSIFKYKSGKITNLCKFKSSDFQKQIYLFDYRYVISSGKSTVRFDQTVFFVNDKALGLPEFSMKPEHLGHRISNYFGWHDIDFEEYPIFSDNYYLKGEQEDFIRHTFNDKVLKYFSKTSGWTVEAANYYMVFYAHKTLIPENILNDFYRVGLGVYELFLDANHK